MKITILSVGKLKERYLKEGVQEYSKRLSAYCKLDVIEIPDEKAPEKLSKKQEMIVKNREGELLLRKMKPGQYVIALCLEGDQKTSPKLANAIKTLQVHGKSDLVFLIGGSLGLSSTILSRADMLLSFSKMTFPHQLMRLILLEQIYRSFKIIKNEPYHK